MKSQNTRKKFQQCMNSPCTDYHQAGTSKAFTVSWIWETPAEQVPSPVLPSFESKSTSLPSQEHWFQNAANTSYNQVSWIAAGICQIHAIPETSGPFLGNVSALVP